MIDTSLQQQHTQDRMALLITEVEAARTCTHYKHLTKLFSLMVVLVTRLVLLLYVWLAGTK